MRKSLSLIHSDFSARAVHRCVIVVIFCQPVLWLFKRVNGCWRMDVRSCFLGTVANGTQWKMFNKLKKNILTIQFFLKFTLILNFQQKGRKSFEDSIQFPLRSTKPLLFKINNHSPYRPVCVVDISDRSL